MRALITGGAGFIGSHITERLLKEGHDVVVLDNFSSGKESNLSFTTQYAIRDTQYEQRNTLSSPSSTQYAIRDTQYENNTQYELIRGDIRDYAVCIKASEGVDAIFHQAALRSVPKSMKDPYSYNEVNINGTLNMLRAAKESGVKRFVFASSSSIYGDTDQFPQKETAYPLLISPYALSKLTGEFYCCIFSENYGLETISLRYFNVFGPRQALYDEYAVVIPKFITSILNDEQPPIFGDGKQSRDFTYIDNIVEANILAATVPLRPKGVLSEAEGRNTQYIIRNTILNVANGRDNTILSLVDNINKILGKSIEPELLPVRKGDVFKTLADVTKLKSILGFKSKVDFQEGLKRTVEYFRKQELLQKF